MGTVFGRDRFGSVCLWVCHSDPIYTLSKNQNLEIPAAGIMPAVPRAADFLVFS